VLADHPHPAEALRELAVSYQIIGDVEEAERCLRSAVGLQPDDWSGWNALGSFLVRVGDYAAARIAYRNAAQLSPPSVTWPQQNEAAVMLYQGEFQEAVNTFERIGGAVADPVLASNLATAYFFLGNLNRAEELYRRAVALDPDNATLHRNLGDLQLRQDRRAEAVASYRRALALVERAARAEHHPAGLPLERAVLEAKVGDCDRALPAAETLWEAMPRSAQVSHDLAQVWALCGERESALEALELAVEAGLAGELIRQEDEFRSLRDLPRFRALTAR
jgi:Flp pilus assembly protein TadD